MRLRFPRAGQNDPEQFYKDLHAAGVRVVQRYLFRSGKGITAREIAAAKAAGVFIVYGFEGYASNWRGGAHQGVIDATEAASIAEELGVPHGTPIYYAVDEDAGGMGMIGTAVAYIKAANRPDYPARAYGSYAVAEALKMPTFQTYAWSGGHVSEYAALYQWHNGQHLAGAEVDFCEIRDAAALGYHPNPGPTLLEWIVTLPGAPQNLTYEQFLTDLATKVWHIDIIPNPSGDEAAVKANPTWEPASVLEQLYKRETQDIKIDEKG